MNSESPKFFKKQYVQNLNTEFYTKEETVRSLIPYLDRSKRYIEPFDREGVSKFYSVLKGEGFDIVHLDKDFDPSDNYDGRVIITNAPYVSRGKIYSRLSKMCDEMYLVMLKFTYLSYTKFRAKDKVGRWCDEWENENLFVVPTFDCPANGGKFETKRIPCVMTHWIRKSEFSLISPMS